MTAIEVRGEVELAEERVDAGARGAARQREHRGDVLEELARRHVGRQRVAGGEEAPGAAHREGVAGDVVPEHARAAGGGAREPEEPAQEEALAHLDALRPEHLLLPMLALCALSALTIAAGALAVRRMEV